MPPSLAHQVYETIKAEIIACVYQPGQQIAQPQLAEKYGAGITPIREALQRLAKEGLVQPLPRFGYIVTPITLAGVNEIYEARSILETAAARLAAVRATQEQLDKICELANYTYIYKDHTSYVDFLTHNKEFHMEVALASGNHRLVDMISQALDEMTRILHLGMDLKDSAEEMRCEHRELFAALDQRDPDEAERIVRAQLILSQQRVLEALISTASSGVSNALGQALHIG